MGSSFFLQVPANVNFLCKKKAFFLAGATLQLLFGCGRGPELPPPSGESCADACAVRAACACLEVTREACVATCRRAVPVGLLDPVSVACAAHAQSCEALDACAQYRCAR